jgi:DNA-binding NarL/FixJ family response regulator
MWKLTPREFEIMQLVCQGCRNKEIAHKLGSSEKTVKNQLYVIYMKFEVHTRFQAMNIFRARFSEITSA